MSRSEWRLSSPKASEVAVVRGPLRGLLGGRFLAASARTTDGEHNSVDGPALITLELT